MIYSACYSARGEVSGIYRAYSNKRMAIKAAKDLALRNIGPGESASYWVIFHGTELEGYAHTGEVRKRKQRAEKGGD